MSINTLADGSLAPAAVVEHRRALLAQFDRPDREPVAALEGTGRRPMTRDDIVLAGLQADEVIAEHRRSIAAARARRVQRPYPVRAASPSGRGPVRAAAAPSRAERSTEALQRARAALYDIGKLKADQAFRERQRINDRRLRHMCR